MRFYLKWQFYILLLILLPFLLVSCGSGDGALIDDIDPIVLEGKFIDSAVEGLSYVSGAEQGETLEDGTFYYEHGEKIVFKIGTLEIGSVVIGSKESEDDEPDYTTQIIDPRDLIGTHDYKDQSVNNIIRFLQTLDEDANPDNGIKIPQTVRENASVKSYSIDFTLSEYEFENSAESVVDELLEGVYFDGHEIVRDLVSADDAQIHFIKSLLTQIVDDAIEDNNIPGVVMGLEIPETHDFYTIARGVSDIENDIPMSADMSFRIGSSTKTFTAIIVTQLVQEGLFQLDDSIGALLPAEANSLLEQKYDTSLITVRDLLQHFSGLPRFFPDERIQQAWFLEPTTQFTPMELVTMMSEIEWYEISDESLQRAIENGVDPNMLALLADYKGSKDTENNVVTLLQELPDFSEGFLAKFLGSTKVTYWPVTVPGDEWRYSNGNYLLLALIIENVTGNSWEDEVRERCINSLGLMDTYVPNNDENTIIGNYISNGYIDLYAETVNSVLGAHGVSGELVNRPELSPTIAWGYGTIFSTVEDLATWIEAVVEGNLLNEEYQDELFNYRYAYGGALGMGLGVMTIFQYNITGHIGQVIGFDAAVEYQNDLEIPIIAFANRTIADGGKINELVVQKAVATLLGEEFIEPEEEH